jgi:hypothetical protein
MGIKVKTLKPKKESLSCSLLGISLEVQLLYFSQGKIHFHIFCWKENLFCSLGGTVEFQPPASLGQRMFSVAYLRLFWGYSLSPRTKNVYKSLPEAELGSASSGNVSYCLPDVSSEVQPPSSSIKRINHVL